MEKKKIDIAIIGQMTLDDIYSINEPVKLDTPGGNALYALSSMWMSSDKQIGVVSRKGYDYDQSFLDSLGSRVDMSGVYLVKDSPNIHLLCIFDRKGHRYYIHQEWGGKDDIMAPIADDIPEHFLSEADGFLVTPFPIENQATVINRIPEDKIILVDPHFYTCYPSDWEQWDPVMPKIDVFLPSEMELVRFFGIDMTDNIADYIPYIKKIAQKGPPIVVVKVGEKGALVYDKMQDICWNIPTFATNVVDVTGCGDCFCAAFSTHYTTHKDAFEAAIHGCVASSFNIEHFTMIPNFDITYQQFQKRREHFAKTISKDSTRIY